MIPVVVMNNEGELSYQVFNDNLAPVEQINRKLLAVLTLAQLELTNTQAAFLTKQGKNGYTTAQIDAINTAASELLKNMTEVVNTFKTALDA